MFISDILWATRNDYLHDLGDDYGRGKLWSDEELLRHLNRIYPELCRETGIIQDVSTAAITQIPILSNQSIYAMDSRITEIHSPVSGVFYDPVSGKYTEVYVDVKDENWLDSNYYQKWRYQTGDVKWLIPYYGVSNFRTVYYPDPLTTGYYSGTFTFASSKTITQTGALFSTYLVAGNQVVISATLLNGTTAVPKTFTVVTLGANSFTVSETVADETHAGIIQKVTMTLNMSVNRLGIQAFTIGGVLTESPEIRSDFHSYLIDGILREAYSKQDSQCLDKEKADQHRRIFEDNKMKIKLAMNWLRTPEQRVKPHFGAL